MSEIKYLDKEGLRHLVGELDKKYQEKLTAGFGIAVHHDATVEGEVEYHEKLVSWIPYDWVGFNLTRGDSVWTDHNGIIHWDNLYYHYYLDKEDSKTWHPQLWLGTAPNHGLHIWEDYRGTIHHDNTSTHLYLDTDEITWKSKSWTGVSPYLSTCVWRDYNGLIHYDYETSHFTLNEDCTTWTPFTWEGINPTDGYCIWTDRKGIIHYDEGDKHYYLNNNCSEWKIFIWEGDLNNFYGKHIWKDHNNTTHYDYETINYYLDIDEVTWKILEWADQSSIQGRYVWRDYTNLIHYDQDVRHYQLQDREKHYYTRHQDELLIKLQSGEGITIENNVISAAVPTKVSDLPNDSGYLTEHQSLEGYATESWVENQGYLTSETDPVFSASAAAGITSADITNWNGKTSNTGTVTSVKVGTTSYTPTSGVISLPAYPTVSYPVSSVAGKTGAVTLSSSDVGLGNVGNFKAVSTVASQGLTDTEKSNARANIGAGTSNLALGTTATTAAAGNHTHSNYLTGITKDMVTTALGYTPPTTDTNTWRGIQNNLTSDSTTDSLSAAQGKALNDKFGSYVAKAGDTMNTGAALIFQPTSDDRKTKIIGGEINFLARTSEGWATGNFWRTNDGGTNLWQTGVYGLAGAIKYAYNGTSYNTPTVKYKDGQVGVAGTLNIGIAKGTADSISGGCKMSYNSTTQCLEFTF